MQLETSSSAQRKRWGSAKYNIVTRGKKKRKGIELNSTRLSREVSDPKISWPWFMKNYATDAGKHSASAKVPRNSKPDSQPYWDRPTIHNSARALQIFGF